MAALEYEAMKATKKVDKYESDLNSLSSIPFKGLPEYAARKPKQA